jgi:hypothetical protein
MPIAFDSHTLIFGSLYLRGPSITEAPRERRIRRGLETSSLHGRGGEVVEDDPEDPAGRAMRQMPSVLSDSEKGPSSSG